MTSEANTPVTGSDIPKGAEGAEGTLTVPSKPSVSVLGKRRSPSSSEAEGHVKKKRVMTEEQRLRKNARARERRAKAKAELEAKTNARNKKHKHRKASASNATEEARNARRREAYQRTIAREQGPYQMAKRATHQAAQRVSQLEAKIAQQRNESEAQIRAAEAALRAEHAKLEEAKRAERATFHPDCMEADAHIQHIEAEMEVANTRLRELRDKRAVWKRQFRNPGPAVASLTWPRVALDVVFDMDTVTETGYGNQLFCTHQLGERDGQPDAIQRVYNALCLQTGTACLGEDARDDSQDCRALFLFQKINNAYRAGKDDPLTAHWIVCLTGTKPVGAVFTCGKDCTSPDIDDAVQDLNPNDNAYYLVRDQLREEHNHYITDHKRQEEWMWKCVEACVDANAVKGPCRSL